MVKGRQVLRGMVTASTRDEDAAPYWIAATRKALVPMLVKGDYPIEKRDEDRLQRSDQAESFARAVLTLDSRRGLVVGVLGPWGAGKTSFINLSRPVFESAGSPVLNFNPWMFSGVAQLMDAFFSELAAQLKLRPGLADIATRLEDYGEFFASFSWIPMVGQALGAPKAVGKLLQHHDGGVAARAKKIGDALAQLSEPIVIVVDDIDRLSSDEVRDIFKLVRLTASFPNVIYILAFDRLRVEEMLDRQGIPGRDYLEKILQLSWDLPAIPRAALHTETMDALMAVTKEVEWINTEDQTRWQDVYAEIVMPLLTSVRDVRRYVAGVHGALGVVGGRISLSDLFALEAVRVFLPETFQRIRESTAALTVVQSAISFREDPVAKDAIEELLSSAGYRRREVVRSVITQLFPAAEQHISTVGYGADSQHAWRRSRRVAHETYLRLYLERVAGAELTAFDAAEAAFTVMHDAVAFESALRSLDGMLVDVVRELLAFRDEYKPNQVVPAGTVLVNLVTEMPDVENGLFALHPSSLVRGHVKALLRTLDSPEEVLKAARAILQEVEDLSRQAIVLTAIGAEGEEGAGVKIPSEKRDELYREWCEQVRTTDEVTLLDEPDLLSVYILARRSKQSSVPIEVPASDAITVALIQSAVTETRGITIGSRAVTREPRLNWDALSTVFGTEEALLARIDSAADQLREYPTLADLVHRYKAGERPEF